jgi:two-component system, sensor histidine kinase and response regulator
MRSLRPTAIDGMVSPRAQELFDQRWHNNARRTDRMFAVLMILQWLGAIIVSLTLSPRTWSGSESYTHPHVWLSVFLGGALTSLPVFLAWKLPGRMLTRHVIAVAQVMFSSLLIHVTGGRIETHFHVFGSLAFLAFYRDWTVLIPATLFVAVDHFVRGVFWPETVFGIVTADPWRWIEHAAWVVFEDIFLIMSCRYGVLEMWSGAMRTAELERMYRDMEQQTSELEIAYRSKNAIVETALDAVIGMDQRGRITGWNSQAEAAFGWTAPEVLGQPLGEVIIPSQFRESYQQGLRKYLESGESCVLHQRIEVSALHRQGHEFPVELAIAPIRSGESVGFCAFIRDITVRLQAAEALHTAKVAAESASHAKSTFLANMSHEIRTPLNGILGFADLLLDEIDGDPEQRRDHVKTIHDSGRHLLTLIDDVLDLSKIESGQMEMDQVRCNPHEIIAATISILRVRAEERGLLLEYFWKSDIPESIDTDPARLRQILMNLVGNAIKFTEVGSVQVAARLQSGGSPRLIIDVMDTGVGIDPAGRDRIFEPFVQADVSITRRFGGTGLGLSISRRLARLLGGDLTVDSELGRGSIFSVSIPTGSLDGVLLTHGSASDVTPARPPLVRSPPQALPPCRILLVEDGVTNRKLISLVLERAGAKIRCAENGRAGVEAGSCESFDLILMDMQMPVMDGYTATRELRRSGCTVPIIALTAHAMAGDERKCRDAGCSGYLTKPIDPLRLLKEVAAALQLASESDSDGHSENDEQALISTLPNEDPGFREIVDEFIASLEGKVAALRTAWKDGDVARIAEIAHGIKGAAGTVGFDSFTQPAANLERLAKNGPSERIVHQIRRLERLLHRIQLPLNNWL